MVLRNTMLLVALLVGACAAAQTTSSAATAHVIKNVYVYNEPGRYAGWPANGGIWGWGNEIVVSFYAGYSRKNVDRYPINDDKPQVFMQSRSLDGGETWTQERPSYIDAEGKEAEATQCPGGIDFTQPNFALQFRMEGCTPGFSRFYWSNDRCRAWNGPYFFPTFDRKGIDARTQYEVNGPHDMTAYVTADKDDGGEGWPFVARTKDGGKSWQFVAWIGPQPEGVGYSIMPTVVRLSDSSSLAIIRRRGRNEQGKKWWWIEAFRSNDNGLNWMKQDEPTINNAGNPAHLIRLKDGRIVFVYGHRLPPYGIRARISDDNGQTFGDDIILRDDGDDWDLGYPRIYERPDGKLVTAYYFNDPSQLERYIGATIWDPGTPGK